MHMALVRVRDGFISAQVSEIFYDAFSASERSETSAEIIHIARETMPYAFISHAGVKVGSLFWSARIVSYCYCEY